MVTHQLQLREWQRKFDNSSTSSSLPTKNIPPLPAADLEHENRDTSDSEVSLSSDSDADLDEYTDLDDDALRHNINEFLCNYLSEPESESEPEPEPGNENEPSDSEESVQSNRSEGNEPLNEMEKEAYLKNLIKEWALEPGVLSISKLDSLLGRLGKAFPSIPKSHKTLLGCAKSKIDIEDLGNGFFQWYKGIKKNLDHILLEEYLNVNKKIMIDINIDGLPLHKSTKLKFWPILGHLVGTDNKPFIIAIHFGEGDPPSLTDFLNVYVAEVLLLTQDGYERNGITYAFEIRNYILDAPARALVKCCVGHAGYAACEKCTVWGEWVDDRIVFIYDNESERNDYSYNSREQPRHHHGDSPLEGIGTGMVSQFRLDSMHLVYKGVFKRLLDFWLVVTNDWKLHGDIVEIISGKFQFLKNFCPSDFSRKPRSLKEHIRFKATEERRMLLYDGIVAFKSGLDENIYKNFLLLHSAIYILASPVLVKTHRSFAEEFLKNFIAHSITLYGKKFCVYNVHSLLHLSKECEAYGELENFSAFMFENFLKSIKADLLGGFKPLQQIAKKDLIRTSSEIKVLLKSTDYPKEPTFSITHNPVPELSGLCYQKIKIGGSILKRGFKDSCFMTTHNEVVILRKVVKMTDKVVLVGKVFQNVSDFYTYPIKSSELNIVSVSHIRQGKKVFNLKDVKCKCYLMPNLDNEYVCVPILHTFKDFQPYEHFDQQSP